MPVASIAQEVHAVSYGRSACGVILARCLLCPSFQSTNAECCVTLLSQTTTVPASHLTRAWKSAPYAKWSYKNFKRASLSSFFKPTISRVTSIQLAYLKVGQFAEGCTYIEGSHIYPSRQWLGVFG